MAYIRKTEGKNQISYHVQIRRKNVTLSASFSSLQTAEIWAKYKEDLIDEMEAFDVKGEDLVTLRTGCDLKVSELKENNVSKRSIEDIEIIKKEFEFILDLPMKNITPVMVRERVNEMLNEVVSRGGSKVSNTGIKAIQSPATVLRKLRCLSAIFSHIIEKGANIENPTNKVVGHLKCSLKKKGLSEED